MHANSGDSSAKRTASRWEGFNESSKNDNPSILIFADGGETPKRTSTNFVLGGVYFSALP